MDCHYRYKTVQVLHLAKVCKFVRTIKKYKKGRLEAAKCLSYKLQLELR